LLVISPGSYYDARIHEYKKKNLVILTTTSMTMLNLTVSVKIIGENLYFKVLRSNFLIHRHQVLFCPLHFIKLLSPNIAQVGHFRRLLIKVKFVWLYWNPIKRICYYGSTAIDEIRTWFAVRITGLAMYRTCHATMSYVCSTFAAVGKQWVLRVLSVCLCPAFNTYASYYHLWPVGLYNISPYYLTNGTIFEKVIENASYVLFSLQLFSDKFPIIEEFSDILSSTSVSLHAKYLLFVSYFDRTLIFLILVFWKTFH
jgi:hypothetical protein